KLYAVDDPPRLWKASSLWTSVQPQAPVVLLRQTMSAKPSPLRSPAPTATSPVAGSATFIVPVTEVPSMLQIMVEPSEFCQRMSDLPSPSKAALVTAFQVAPGLASVACDATEVPVRSSSHTSGVPAAGSPPRLRPVGGPPPFWSRTSEMPSALKSSR